MKFPLLAAGIVASAALALIALPQKSQGRENETPDARNQTTEVEASKAVFAGGCFWCVEADFEKLAGVIEAESGYTGGYVENPTYKQVTKENTGHYEAVEVLYDASIVSYKELVDFHFRHIDPLDDGGQFCDRGASYKTAIFVLTPEERAIAEAAKSEASAVLGEEIVTPILELTTFWLAEDYHQDYYKKNPLRYRYYRTSCRRDRRVKALWGERG